MTKILQFAKSKSGLGLLVFGLLLTQYANSQCAFSANPYGGTTAPTTIGATNTASTCSFLGEYSPITGFLSSNVYTLAVNTPSYITVFNAANVAVAWGPSPLSFTPPANGNYNCQWNTSTGCGSQTSCFVTTVNLVGPSAACTNPANAGTATSTPAAACAGQSFSLAITGASTGSSLTYQWQSSPAGVTYTNIAGATSPTYSLMQTASTYYRCVVTCSAGTPANSVPVQVNMSSFLNCYCTSTATAAFDEEILNVTIGSLSNTSTCGTTGGPGSTSSLYSNYTNVTPALALPNLTQGFSYPLSLGIGTCGGNYNNITKVWIDYNQNGLFTDPGEQVYTPTTFVNGVHTINATVTIPATAIPGTTRMRVVNMETTTVTAVVPCGTYAYGETEDYFVNITVPLAEDAGITAFVNPVVPTCTFNDSVTVTLKNFGTDTLTSVNINWKRNTTTLAPFFWTGSLAPLASVNVFIGTTPYVVTDNLYAWTSNPNGVIENPAGAYNDSTSIINLSTGMSGTFTIGGTTPDFIDILSAVNALNSVGVCGPVTFNIRTNTYYDQFSLGSVIGMNATNTVTFRSEAGHRDSVTVEYGVAGTTNNYILKMNGADYFRFEKMTLRNPSASFGRVLDISGGSDNNIFFDCALITQTTNSTSTNFVVIWSGASNDNFNKFDGCSIIGGSYGAYWYGTSITSLEKGTVFSNNKFIDNFQYGIRSYFQEDLNVTKNHLYGVSTNTFRYGLFLGYCDKASVITHNVIESNPSTFWTYGIYTTFCSSNALAKGLIANNSISVGNPGSTATSYGMFFDNSGHLNIYNNSVNVAGGGTLSRALHVNSGGANVIKNNTFTNFGAGYAAYIIGNFGVNEMNYNNLYSTGPNFAFFVSNIATFAAWQSQTGFGANSVNVNPGFYSNYDLHLCADSLNNKGTSLVEVTDDIDGQVRNATTPDIGFDEYSPLGTPGFVGPDALICTGQTVTLFAGAPSDQIIWAPTGDTTNMIVVTTPGTYSVTVIGSCGIAFDTVVVTASALNYTGFLNASQTTFCSGGSALLTSTMPASTYAWTGGSTNDSLVVTTSGNYTLNITDGCGSGSQTVAITVNTAPVASFTTIQSFLSGAFTNTSTTGGAAVTYLWNFGDGSTSTDMSPSHIYTTVGTFTVTLTVTNACGTNTSTSTITTSNLGLEEIAGLGSIAVYPNPSNGLFQIDFNMNNDVNIEIRVTNILGESVFVKNLGSINGSHKDAINITNAAPGVYYVTVISDSNVVMTSKLVKQ